MEQFSYAYTRVCPGKTLVYDATGSAAGVAGFMAGTSDLAGSATPLDPTAGQVERAAERCDSPAWDLPIVFGPISLAYHIDGIDSLNLDGPTVAKIFNGTIATWDHPAIKALNTGVALPAVPVHVVYRSDTSGPTAAFQKYLETASDGAWFGGHGEIFNGGIGEGVTGNTGVASALHNTDGAITYSDWSFAVGEKLPMASLVSSAGRTPVAISAESVGKTIAGATFIASSAPDNDLVIDVSSIYKPAVDGAYPIVSPTYEIVCSVYPDRATGVAVRAFLRAALGPGQDALDQYGFIPVPAEFKSRLLAAVDVVT